MTTNRLLRVILVALLLVPLCSFSKTYKIATISPDGLAWMKKLRAGTDEIEAATEGRVKFKIYPGGVQGDDYTVLRKMRIGQLHGGVVAAGSLTRFYSDLQIYNLPMKFRSDQEVDYVRQRMDQRIVDGLSSGGVVSFNLTETGFAYLMSRKPVRTVEDLKNLKTWVPEKDEMSAKLLQSFGISPIPLYITDVLTGLQTGTIDAVAVPPIVALALQWHNHVKYVTDLPLMYVYSMLMLDKKAFDRMQPEDQAVVNRVMNRVFAEIDASNRTDNLAAYDALLNQGIERIEPALEKVEDWEALADASVEALIDAGEISRESLEILNQYLEEARAKRQASR